MPNSIGHPINTFEIYRDVLRFLKIIQNGKKIFPPKLIVSDQHNFGFI